jgi:glycosyltransferase involved in cell wall biosynthesis
MPTARPIDLTVLLPFKGQSTYIFSAIESVFYNSNINVKLILIYKDEEQSFLGKLRDYSSQFENVEFLQVKQGGLAHALATGVVQSTTEYVARIDSDDLVLPGRFELQLAYLTENPRVAVVGSQVEYINQNGFKLGKSEYPESPEHVRNRLVEACHIAHPSVMFRRSSILKAGNYQEYYSEGGISIAEDYYLWLRVQDFFEIANLHQPLIQYRQHTDQISGKNLIVIWEQTLRLTSTSLIMQILARKFKDCHSFVSSKDTFEVFKYVINNRSFLDFKVFLKWKRAILVWSLRYLKVQFKTFNFIRASKASRVIIKVIIVSLIDSVKSNN